jgi:hypothetical protein
MGDPKCTLFTNFIRNEKTGLFFSITWCRDRLFVSDDPADIMKFYGTFRNNRELIEWMTERPKGRAEIIEVEGDKRVIAVLATGNYDGKYAKECRDNIFNGLHMVFVESGYPKDPYFNYAHSYNVGIKRALSHNPKWIVISNDDMQKIDSIEVLREELTKAESEGADVVLARESKNHTTRRKIARYNILFFLYYWLTNDLEGRNLLRLYDKFKVHYLIAPQKGLGSKFFRRGYNYTEIQDFGIFSSDFIRKKNGFLFDETFISSTEDTDLSLWVNLSKTKVLHSNFKIGSLIGGSIGVGAARSMRDVAGLVYLNKKWCSELTNADKKSTYTIFREKESTPLWVSECKEIEGDYRRNGQKQ